MKKKIADLIGRISGCVIVGVIVGIIFGLPNYPTASTGVLSGRVGVDVLLSRSAI